MMLFNFLLRNADTCVSKVVSFKLHYQSICMLRKLMLEILISSKYSTTLI